MADPSLSWMALLQALEIPGIPARIVQVLEALVLVAAGALLGFAVFRAMDGLGEKARDSRFRFDGVFVRVLSRPLAALVVLFALLHAGRRIEGLRAWIARWPGVEQALLVLAGTWVVADLIKQTVEVYGRPRVESTASDFDDRLLGIVDLAATLIVWIVGVLLALHTLGIAITPVLASMGVAGLAVALAVRTILSNFFGGLVVTADPTLQRGHRVEVGEWVGDVVDIGRYKTTIRTRENLLVSLPNDQLMRETVVNHNLPASRTRMEMTVGVDYEANIETVERILLEIVEEIEATVEEPAPEANVAAFGESAIEIQILAWQQRPREKRLTRDEVYREVLRRFDAEGIEIPYPHMDVRFPEGRPADEGG
ncbi:mechanosensitive ion channel protein MscS [Thermoplasmatales archaeon SW_10_69_26]|nr:MAG: mechanosensitive ion channel protein MscS [Thermoplasmatales archaeon SW_10_69_26]